jgi:hypothetical protein
VSESFTQDYTVLPRRPEKPMVGKAHAAGVRARRARDTFQITGGCRYSTRSECTATASEPPESLPRLGFELYRGQMMLLEIFGELGAKQRAAHSQKHQEPMAD